MLRTVAVLNRTGALRNVSPNFFLSTSTPDKDGIVAKRKPRQTKRNSQPLEPEPEPTISGDVVASIEGSSHGSESASSTVELQPRSELLLELRKLSITGRIQVWRASIQGKVGVVNWGVENGKMQQITRTVTEGKQKRNPGEQLKMELRSIAKKKMSKDGYELAFGSLDDTSVVEGDSEATSKSNRVSSRLEFNRETQRSSVKVNPPLPMLAKVWSNDVLVDLTVETKIHVQPKLDGLRCIADLETGELWSRARKPFEGLDHISQAILDIPDRRALLAEGIRYIDGEVYHHGLDFQEITSIARRTSVNPHENSRMLDYYVFDACSDRMNFEQRWGLLQTLAIPKRGDLANAGPLYQTDTNLIPLDGFDATAELKSFTSLGFEGAMVRLSPLSINAKTREGVYRSGVRSSCLLKVKQFQQEEYKVIEFQKHRELETLGSVLLALPNGQTFSATPAQSAKSKVEMWVNREEYRKPGWIATVQFQDLSRTGVPRFPVLLGFRHVDDR